jgi:hypothetical protein
MVKLRVLRFEKMTVDNMKFEFGTITLLVSFIIHSDFLVEQPIIQPFPQIILFVYLN